MTVLESILKDLQGLSARKLVEVARYVHRLSEAAQKERELVLRQTHGCLSEEDGRAFEEAPGGLNPEATSYPSAVQERSSLQLAPPFHVVRH